MIHWTELLGLRSKTTVNGSRNEASSAVRLLVITANCHFYASLVDIASSAGWEMRRAGTIEEGLDVVRSLCVPLVLFDWEKNGPDWRDAVARLGAAPNHPCVLLASPVVDDNLRQEVMRFHGYDVLGKSMDRDQIVRAIRFAWFWACSQPFADRAKQQEESH